MVLPVTEVMRKKLALCSPDTKVTDATKLLEKFNTSTVIVIDKDRHVMGVFSERDLVNRVVNKNKNPKTTIVSDVMTTPVICGDVSQNDVDIAALIVKEHIKKVPILKKGKVVGVVAESDLLRKLAESILADDDG
jgi:signal-transduction protein with cAMP-binding, CBS, and nucleotidyltransferase domain